MSKVIPFKLDHFEVMELRDSEKEFLGLDPGGAHKLEALTKYGMGGTLFCDGRIVAIIGYYEMYPGVIEVWSFPSKYITQYGRTYLKTAKSYVQSLDRMFKPHRIQSTAIADDVHDRWMKFLGFTCEGTLKKYSVSQQDYRMWARTQEGQ